jgi:UDP-sugar pyrophosphorylase
MVSDDTNDRTLDLLKANNYFGLNPSQLEILK